MSKKKLSYVIASAVFALVVGLSVCLAVFLPKNTKADENTEYYVNGVSTSTEQATVTGADSAPISEKGGAIFLEKDATFTMNAGSISGHSKKYGGAIYISAGATFTMNGGEISGNTAAYGGAIYIEKGGHCYIYGGSITGNGASVSPAIHVEPGAELVLGNPETGELPTISGNFESEFGYTVKYYVDGSLALTQFIEDTGEEIVLAEEDAPLSYEECCGYYLEEDLVTSVDDTTEIQTSVSAFAPNITTQTSTPLFNEKRSACRSYDANASQFFLNRRGCNCIF